MRYASIAIAWGLAACSATTPAPAPPSPTVASEKQAAPSVGLRNVEPARAPEPQKPKAEAPKPPAKSAPPTPPATPKPPAPAKPPAAPKSSPVPEVARAAPLDLKSLEQRLKDTGSIGVLTKLSLKNQVDDLVDRFRAYHAGTRPPTLTELRPSFDLLLMKVLALLQDKDPSLAHDIDASRDAIWGVLSDRQKFAQYS